MRRKLSAFLLVLVLGTGNVPAALANILEPGGIGAYVPPVVAPRFVVPAPARTSVPIPAMRASSASSVAATPFLVPKAPALAPMGFLVFCSNNPEQCQTRSGVSKVWLHQRELSQLETINRLVNHRVEQVNDSGRGLEADTWTIAAAKGDCEDVALAKRDLLIRSGWPASTLRMAVTRTPWGEGHAVLVVSTDKGDFVLDSRFDIIKRWNQTDLTWIKVQSADNPLFWYAV